MRKCCITFFIVLSLFAVLWFSWRFMDRITSVLEHKNLFRGDVGTTNIVCKCQNIVASKVRDVHQFKDHDSVIIAAYDSLSNELSSWMSIMGIFSVVFGLMIPVGSYLLQHMSFKEERDRIRDEMEEVAKNTFGPMWRFMGATYHRLLAGEANEMFLLVRSKKFDDSVGVVKVVNFFISFDIYLDCMVRTGDAIAVITACKEFKPYLENFRSNEKMWDNFINLYRKGLQNSGDFVSGKEFAKLIGRNNEYYKWLKELYNEIIPWKFSS